MNLLWMEMKKIWRPGVAAGIVILSLLLGYMFLSFRLEHFPNGHPGTELYDIAVSWTERFGTTLEEGERAEAESDLEALYREADRLIGADKAFAEMGMENYEDYCLLEQGIYDSGTEEEMQTIWRLNDSEFDFIGFKIQALESVFSDYDERYIRHVGPEESTLSEKEAARIKAIEGGDLTGITYNDALENIWDYTRWCTVIIIMGITVLLAPYLTRDGLMRVRQLQWTSKRGRKIIKTQLLAAALSGFVLTAAEAAIMTLLYMPLGTQKLWQNPIQGFKTSMAYWFDMTYGQYVTAVAAVGLAVAVGSVGIMFMLSRFSSGYINLLFKVLPVLAVLMAAAKLIIEQLLGFGNFFGSVSGSPLWDVFAAGAVLAVGIGLAAFTVIREKKAELL